MLCALAVNARLLSTPQHNYSLLHAPPKNKKQKVHTKVISTYPPTGSSATGSDFKVSRDMLGAARGRLISRAV